jgi:hypothetical protein
MPGATVPAVHTRVELEAGEEDVLVEVTSVEVELGGVEVSLLVGCVEDDVLTVLLVGWVEVDVLLVLEGG